MDPSGGRAAVGNCILAVFRQDDSSFTFRYNRVKKHAVKCKKYSNDGVCSDIA